MVEIVEEYDQRHEKLPDLIIEKDILFYYPLPMYFWFSKTKRGIRLAERVRRGMWAMIEDGTHNKIFNKYHGWKIEKLRIKGRRIFKIQNSNLGPETPFEDKRLWFNPLSN